MPGRACDPACNMMSSRLRITLTARWPAPIVAAAMTEGEAGGIVQTPSARRAKRVVALTGARTFLGKGLLSVLAEDDRIARVVVLDDETTREPKREVAPFVDKLRGDKLRSYVV